MKEIAFYRPSIDDNEIKLVNEVLKLDKSNKVETLEDNAKRYIGTKHTISTCNGTAAAHLAMCALDLKRGDKFICSVNSFPSLAEVVRHFDAEPIFVDINIDNFNIDTNKLEETLNKHKHKKLKGAFISNVAGQASDYDDIYKLADIYNIKIVDDATDALGATYKGKKIGSLKSDISCFRFSPQMKNSIAGGGLITTNNDEIDERARLLRNHAFVSESWDKFGNLGYIYDVVDIGVKYDLNELSAAYNVAQLEKTEKFIKRRQEIAQIYHEELADIPHLQLPAKQKEHIYTQYIIKIDKNRDGFARELRDRGIYTGLHFIPLNLLTYYKSKYSLKVNDFPNALKNYQQILSIPIYHALSNDEVYYVCEQIKDIAKNRA